MFAQMPIILFDACLKCLWQQHVVGDRKAPNAVRLYPAVQAGILGSVARAVDFNDPNQSTGPGAILPGMTLNFQCYFRDNVSGVPTFNFSDAMSVLFCP